MGPQGRGEEGAAGSGRAGEEGDDDDDDDDEDTAENIGEELEEAEEVLKKDFQEACGGGFQELKGQRMYLMNRSSETDKTD